MRYAYSEILTPLEDVTNLEAHVRRLRSLRVHHPEWLCEVWLRIRLLTVEDRLAELQEEMESTRFCSQCGTRLLIDLLPQTPGGAWKKHCPTCLFEVGFDPETAGPRTYERFYFHQGGEEHAE